MAKVTVFSSDLQRRLRLARERLKIQTPREQEIQRELAQLSAEMRQEYKKRVQPLLDELAEID